MGMWTIWLSAVAPCGCYGEILDFEIMDVRRRSRRSPKGEGGHVVSAAACVASYGAIVVVRIEEFVMLESLVNKAYQGQQE